MKKIWALIAITIIVFSCKTETKTNEGMPKKNLAEQISDEAGKVITEDVYEIKDNGEKGEKVFIIEGTKLYSIGSNGSKDLMLEKRGNKVYNFSNGQNGSTAVLIFEGDQYWEIDENTGEKGELLFERKGNIIYMGNDGKMEKAFIVD